MNRLEYQREYYKRRYHEDPIYREKIKARGRQGHKNNPERNRKQSAKWIKDNPVKSILMRTKQRARLKGWEFDLTENDITIPEYCPVLGMKLEIHHGNKKHEDNSVSVDRINSTKGYVKNNIIIVSQKANQIKSDATVDELNAVARFYSKLINKSEEFNVE